MACRVTGYTVSCSCYINGVPDLGINALMTGVTGQGSFLSSGVISFLRLWIA